MNTHIIPVFTAIVADESVQLCNARELHSTLQVGRDFATWIKERVDTYGDGASNVTVMNSRDVFMLASQTTQLLNTAGDALETIHRLEKHLGRNLYQRKQHGQFGHFGLPESLVESVINAAQLKEAA